MLSLTSSAYDEQLVKKVVYKQAKKNRRQQSTLTTPATTINKELKAILDLEEKIEDLTNDTIGLLMAAIDLRDLPTKVKQQSDRLAILEACAAKDIFNIRASILASVSQCPISAHRTLAQHISAHGGNIVADTEAIDKMDEIYPDHASKWRAGFESLYGLSFDPYKSAIIDALQGSESERNAVQHLITTCNIRATTQVMNVWSDAENCRYQLLCDVLIAGCIENKFSVEYWGRPEAVTAFNKLVKSYEYVLYQ